MSVGYDHVDVAECKRRGVAVGFTPDVLTDSTADIALSLILCASRRVPEALASVRDGTWGEWTPMWMCGKGLQGATVGVVGMGRIGEAVSQRLRAFRVGSLLYSGPSEKPAAAGRLGAEYVGFDDLLARSDFVVVTASLNDATRGVFNRTAFSKMKKDAVFVNVSRGGLVQQDDLIEALDRGVIGAAGLDVTTPEPLPTTSRLLALKNCVVFPHIGSATVETREAMGRLAVENVVAAVLGRSMPHRVPGT